MLNTERPPFQKAINTYRHDPRRVTTEILDHTGTTLTCFFFRFGANFYVLTHSTNGQPSHTLIDAGDTRYRSRLNSILTENGISPDRIERIIITHSHHDHFGMADLMAQASDASILLHKNFKHFLDGNLNEYQRRWLRGFDLDWLRNCRLKYLDPADSMAQTTVHGLGFPILASLPVGDGSLLEILACPESDRMHTTDQLVVRYSAGNPLSKASGINDGFRPGNDILFSGDLWLMHGPMFAKGFRHFKMHLRFAYHRAKLKLSGQRVPRRDPRVQDAAAKDALKQGFRMIRVMPGHGDEFLGTRVIPRSFLARRDLLVTLGYSMDADLSVLDSPESALRISELREEAYSAFVEELQSWLASGYTPAEISGFLSRIYKEQAGGGKLVRADRKERRRQIKKTLGRMASDSSIGKGLQGIAEPSLSMIRRMR